jgi:predicted TIM-barrel fold metal-dependent hydrolase
MAVIASSIKPLSFIGKHLRLFKTGVVMHPAGDGSGQLDATDAWDSHMHIIDLMRYPLAANAVYAPPEHSLDEALRFESQLGISNIVLVQPSIYGNDNSCLLDALRKLGPTRARGVVVFDHTQIDVAALREWHSLGVRGVRLNFQSTERQVCEHDLVDTLQNYARLIRPLGWVLQLYIPLAMANVLEKVVPSLGVKICLDHYGFPSTPEGPVYKSFDPYSVNGFPAMARLLEQGSTWVKISAPYRFCKDERQVELLTKELLRIREGRRVVFATDWPHTRFTGLDIRPFAEKVVSCCEKDPTLVRRVFRDNAHELWNVSTREIGEVSNVMVSVESSL